MQRPSPQVRARIRFLRPLCSTWARPSSSGAGGTAEARAGGTVEAWARSEDNPVGGWYGLRKGYRGRFPMCSSERDPVAVLGEHRVQVVDRAEVVAQLGLADLDHERRRVERLVAPRLELDELGGVLSVHGSLGVPSAIPASLHACLQPARELIE
jgi:hypothetical protein